MPFRLFSLLSDLTFGTYNDVTGNQTNTYNGRYYNSYNLSSLLTGDIDTVQGINVYNQHSNVHEDLICGMFQ